MMVSILVTFIVSLLQLNVLHGAKILTLCFLGGSHYLLMDEVTRILQDNGHEVRMFQQIGEGTLPGYKQPPSPYPVTTYSFDDQYLKDVMELFVKYQKRFLAGRKDLDSVFTHYKVMSYQCNITLHQSDIFRFLKAERYDIAVVEGFNPCSFLVAEKLGLPYIAFYPEIFINAAHLGMPSPLSYVPVFESHLTDRMDFFGRLKNTFMYFAAYVVDMIINSIFSDVIEEHFPSDSRPSLYDLYMKAELWMYNVDFTIEFARPLLPNIQYIGGLLGKPAKPVSQDLEDFIAESGDAGFIVVTMGSMLSSLPLVEFLKEMNDGFTKIPQKVIWRYNSSEWPEDLIIAPNVRIMDWISQNDLLGHPKVQLLVTHGGLNSLMEAVYHGVPVVGIPLFGDQYENMVRIEAKNMGKVIPPDQMEAEYFAKTMQEVMEDESYKKSAMKQSAIRKSHPLPPDQKVLRWVEHIIHSGGGGHLRPYSYHQPWYQRCLLDIILFISICLIVSAYLIVKLFQALFNKPRSVGKQKQN